MKEKRNKIDPGSIRPELKRLLQERAGSGGIPCAGLFSDVVSKGFSPNEVGLALDSLELRISYCQLGLFGYQPEKKKVHPLASVEPQLQQEIERVQQDGRIICSEAWAIAQTCNVPKLHVACACETLGVRIKSCQLGAFE